MECSVLQTGCPNLSTFRGPHPELLLKLPVLLFWRNQDSRSATEEEGHVELEF